MSPVAIVIIGCVGGLMPDLLRIIKFKYKKALPSYFRNLNFWISLLLQVALGGFVAWLLQAQGLPEAFAYGFSAPEMITKLVSDTSKERGGEFELRKWWAN